MKATTVTVSEKGQIALPVDFRDDLGIKKGDILVLVKDSNRIFIEKEDFVVGKFRDDFKDLIKHSEKVAKKLWDNKADEVWNNV